MLTSNKTILITFSIGIASFIVSNLFFKGFHFNSVSHLIIDVLMNQLYAFVLGYSNMWFFAYLRRRSWNQEDSFKRIFLSITGSTLITLIGLFLLRLVTVLSTGRYSFLEFISREKFSNYYFGLGLTFVVITLFHAIYFYNRYQQNRLKEQKAIVGTVSAKFNALKNQLDPHFLFNSLNVLNSLIEENPEAAQRFTTALSKVYRYVLEQKDKTLVTVEEELQFAKTYMSLLKMRFEDSIIFEMPQRILHPDSKVVPLALQLLLENAVKHNRVTSSAPLYIKIYESEGCLVVENNLQPKQIIKRSGGVGLNNIEQRYSLLTRKTVQIAKGTDKFAVSLPLITDSESVFTSPASPQKDEVYARALNHVDALKKFYYSLMAFSVVMPFLIYVNYSTSWRFHWFWFPLLGWGLGLFIRAIKVFVPAGHIGKRWEKRKVEEFIKKERTER